MLHVAVSDTVRAPRRTVLDVYGDYAGWPDLFPTISGVRLLGREGDKLALEVDHVEGKVLNELLVRPPGTLDLWEEKRHYDARFLNRAGLPGRRGGGRPRLLPGPATGLVSRWAAKIGLYNGLGLSAARTSSTGRCSPRWATSLPGLVPVHCPDA